MIRVLIAEDSATCLGLLVELIGSDPQLKVIGTATHGAEAVTMTRDLRPDVVVMDIHMPVMDGFEATRHIMTDAPTPIVIVSATIDVNAVSVSMHALRLGALAVMPKPTLSGGDFSEMTRQFTTTIRSMAQVRVVRRWNERSSLPPIVTRTPAPARNTPVRALAIAASTGGPGALYRILPELPRELSVPILVVQHIADGFVGGLATWLGAASHLTVKVAEHGERLCAGTVYIAPDDRHLGMSKRDTVEIVDLPPIGGFRPSATYLFESVASVCGPASLAVVLTGMGEDGCPGLQAIHAAGGRVIAQDEETSIVFGMPGAAVAAGVAHAVLPLHMIAPRLSRLLEKNHYQEPTA
jgi:two-component system, chemotaxis family, protein-glutamate methylesterase/glutaminase